MSELKIAMVSCDWKGCMDARDVQNAVSAAGTHIHAVPQDEVDSIVWLVASEPLTVEQTLAVWEAGDLWAEDEECWTGASLVEILMQLAEHRGDAEGDKA